MAATAINRHDTRMADDATYAHVRLLTVEEAADYLSVSIRFVRRIIHERRIAVVRLGRHVRLAEPDLKAFVVAGREPALSSSTASVWRR
jgi:excisionase family DNA binding protein